MTYASAADLDHERIGLRAHQFQRCTLGLHRSGVPLAAVCARPPHPQPARVRLVIIRDTRTRLLDRFTLSQITVHAANRPPAAAATTAASHVIVGATRVRAPDASAGAGGFVGTCAGAGAGSRAVSLTRALARAARRLASTVLPRWVENN